MPQFVRQKFTEQRKSNFSRRRKKHCDRNIESSAGETPIMEYSSLEIRTIFEVIRSALANVNVVQSRTSLTVEPY